MELLEVTTENIFGQIGKSTVELREAGRVFKTNNLRDLGGTFNCIHSFQDAVKTLLKEGKIKLIPSFTLPPNKDLTTAQKRDLDLILNQTDWSLCNVNPFNVVLKANTRGCNTRVLNSLVKKEFLAEKDYDFYEELYIKEGVRKREFLITAKALIIQVVLTPNHEYDFKESQEEVQEDNLNFTLDCLYKVSKDQGDFVTLEQVKIALKDFNHDELLRWGGLSLKYTARRIKGQVVFGLESTQLLKHLVTVHQVQEETQETPIEKFYQTLEAISSEGFIPAYKVQKAIELVLSCTGFDVSIQYAEDVNSRFIYYTRELDGVKSHGIKLKAQEERMKTQEERMKTQEERMNKLGLTSLEKNLLSKVLDHLYEEYFSDITLEDVSEDLNRDRGVLASLIKKGILEIEEYESQHYQANIQNPRASKWIDKTCSMIHLCNPHWSIFKPEWTQDFRG